MAPSCTAQIEWLLNMCSQEVLFLYLLNTAKPASFSIKFKDNFLQEVVPKVYNTGLVKSVPL